MIINVISYSKKGAEGGTFIGGKPANPVGERLANPPKVPGDFAPDLNPQPPKGQDVYPV